MAISLASPPAFAAIGTFLNGWGANNRALAGAGVAFAEDPMVIAVNPAGLLGLQKQTLNVGSSFLRSEQSFRAEDVDTSTAPPGAFAFAPGKRWAEHDVPAEVERVFPIPFAAANWRLNDSNAVGLAIYGNGGLNSNFKAFDNPNCPTGTPQQGYFCFGDVGSDIAQVFISPTWAHEINDKLVLGVSPAIIYQTIEVRGYKLFANRSSDPQNISNNGHSSSWGYALKLGATIEITDTVKFGITGQTRGRMQKHDEYAGLLPEQGSLDVAPYLQTGVSWQLSPRTSVMLDYQRIYFSKINALGNSGFSAGFYGDDNGPGFGWKNSRTWKLGLHHQVNDRLTLRLGAADNNDLVSNTEMVNNFVSAALFDEQFTIGTSWKTLAGNVLDFSFNYTTRQKLSGENPLFPGQKISSENGLYTLDIGWRTEL